MAIKTKKTIARLDVAFDGTWVLVPKADAKGTITGVDVYSPSCNHPHGVYFTAAIDPNPWPPAGAFYMLDGHSQLLVVRETSKRKPMNISQIDKSINHIITPPRPLSSNWDVLISIPTGPDAWVSSDTVVPTSTDTHGNTVPCFVGADAPAGKVSSMQTLTFHNVTGVSLDGAPAAAQALLPSPYNVDGTLIFEGESPYIPTLQHERDAIAATANLAGLDLLLNYPLPSSKSSKVKSGPIQVMTRIDGACGHSVIVLPDPAGGNS